MLFTYLGISWHVSWLSCVLAGVIFITALLLTKWVGCIEHLPKTQDDRTSMVLYSIGFAVISFCFLARTNNDYRFIFFLMTVPWLLRIVRSQPYKSRAKFWVLTSFALMISYAWSGPFILKVIPHAIAKLSTTGVAVAYEEAQNYLLFAKAALSWILILFLTVIFLKTLSVSAYITAATAGVGRTGFLSRSH